MKLKKLVLENFQGIRSLEFEPNGNDASVYGTNGSGKTTVYNALTWLLFDKASTGEKGFSPKTKDENGEDFHNRSNIVEGAFILDDGTIITLRKELKELWIKKRDSKTETFSGNTTDYRIDGVPTTKSQYDLRLTEICPSEKTQILTQPEYFPETMTSTERRKLLIEVCGDVTEFEVINSSPELKKITQYLLKPGTSGQFYTVEEFQKIAAAKKKEIDLQVKHLPARIDEAAKAVPDIRGFKEDEIKSTIEALQAEKESLLVEKANISQSEAEQINRRRLSEIQTAIAEGRVRFNENKNAELSDKRQNLAKLKSDRQQLSYKLQETRENIAYTTKKLESLKNRRELLSEKYRTIKESVWNGDSICSACGQALPADSVEEDKAKFNLHKSDVMEQIRATIESECSKVIIAEFEEKIQNSKAAEISTSEYIKCLDDEINIKADQIRPKEQEHYEETTEFATYTAQVAQIQEEIKNGSVDTNESKRALQAKIEGVQALIDKEQRKLLLIENAVDQQKRIEELEADEKRLNKEYEFISHGLHLCDEFDKAQAAMLGDKVNDKFTSVKFRLFIVQINGDLKKDCEVMIPTENGLVPFSTANNAARINAGLEIIDCLSKHWGVSMPVFIDNSESVVKLKKIGSQVIRLVVSEADEKLRMEID